jgi:hypothetical protein
MQEMCQQNKKRDLDIVHIPLCNILRPLPYQSSLIICKQVAHFVLAVYEDHG